MGIRIQRIPIIYQGEYMTRRALREHCFKMLFCTDFYPVNEADEQIKLYFDSVPEDDTDEEGNSEVIHEVKVAEKDQEELQKRVDEIIAKIPDLDEKISAATEGWAIKRIGRVELTILRLALYEMKYDENIPEKVAINEAVEVAKKFGGDESPAFINGVLAKLVEDKPAD